MTSNPKEEFGDYYYRLFYSSGFCIFLDTLDMASSIMEYSLLELREISLFKRDFDWKLPPLCSDAEMDFEIVETKKKDKSFVDEPKFATPISFFEAYKYTFFIIANILSVQFVIVTMFRHMFLYAKSLTNGSNLSPSGVTHGNLSYS